MYNAETKDMIGKTDDLTNEEKGLFQSAVTFARDNDIDLEGQAVSKIIADEQVRLEEERQRLEEERKKEEERKRELQRQKDEEIRKLNNSIQVTLDGKGAIAKDSDAWRFSDVITFDLTFKNTTDKDVRGFKGTAIFNNLFGDNIKKLTVSYDEGVSANSEKYWEGMIEVNQFIDKDIELRDIDFMNLNFEFEMDMIIFSDGTTLTKNGHSAQTKNTQTTQTKDTQTKDTENPYEWASGVKEKFEATMLERGYVDSIDTLRYEQSHTSDNQGFYTVYGKLDGEEQYIVVVNVKTGWFHG